MKWWGLRELEKRLHDRKEGWKTCPDGGRCWHHCKDGECFRVATCVPLSGVYPDDKWPEDLKPLADRFFARSNTEVEKTDISVTRVDEEGGVKTTVTDVFRALYESGWELDSETFAWRRGRHSIACECVEDIIEMHRWFLPRFTRAIRDGMTELRFEAGECGIEFFILYGDIVYVGGGKYTDEKGQEIDPNTPLDPKNMPYIPLQDNPTCYACFMEAEEKRTGWTKMVALEHGYDQLGNKCQCQKLWEEAKKEIEDE
jgi:hypothetical protein